MMALGIIGGPNWVSVIEFCRTTNRVIREKLGSNHSAEFLLYSFKFNELAALVAKEDWIRAGDHLIVAAQGLQDIGANGILLFMNIPQIVKERIGKCICIPLITMAETTTAEIRTRGVTRIGLLGSKPVMEKNYFTNSLDEENIEMVIPDPGDRCFVHSCLTDGLAQFANDPHTRKRITAILHQFLQEGVEGIIVADPALLPLLKGAPVTLRIFDSTLIHAKAAADFTMIQDAKHPAAKRARMN